MRELLIRYLLGELEPAEHEEVQQRLVESAELQRELAHLRACISDACRDDESSTALPRGLAERTTDRVASSSDEWPAQPSSLTGAATADPPSGALGWSLADLTVAGGVILAVSMLLYPALLESREGTRRTGCQNNQRQVYFLLADFAENNGGGLARLGPSDDAGMLVRKLIDDNYVRGEDLAIIMVCPGSPLADKFRAGELPRKVPSSAEMKAMAPAELAEAKRNTSPFLDLRFPYWVGNNLHYIKYEPVAFSPWFGDTAGSEQDGYMSPNHWRVMQVMNQDGNLRSLTSCVVPGLNDNLFRNALGKVAAGCNRQDVVLGNSAATPGEPIDAFQK